VTAIGTVTLPGVALVTDAAVVTGAVCDRTQTGKMIKNETNIFVTNFMVK